MKCSEGNDGLTRGSRRLLRQSADRSPSLLLCRSPSRLASQQQEATVEQGGRRAPSVLSDRRRRRGDTRRHARTKRRTLRLRRSRVGGRNTAVPLGAPQNASVRQREIRQNRPEGVRHADADGPPSPARRRSGHRRRLPPVTLVRVCERCWCLPPSLPPPPLPQTGLCLLVLLQMFNRQINPRN